MRTVFHILVWPFFLFSSVHHAFIDFEFPRHSCIGFTRSTYLFVISSQTPSMGKATAIFLALTPTTFGFLQLSITAASLLNFYLLYPSFLLACKLVALLESYISIVGDVHIHIFYPGRHFIPFSGLRPIASLQFAVCIIPTYRPLYQPSP